MSKHEHYYKDVADMEAIDVYDVCRLFDIDDPSGAMQHAIKKLLCAGKRGGKSKVQDVQEAVDSLHRWLEMHELI